MSSTFGLAAAAGARAASASAERTASRVAVMGVAPPQYVASGGRKSPEGPTTRGTYVPRSLGCTSVSTRAGLRQRRVDDLAAVVGQPLGAAVVAEGEPLVVKPEQVQD